MVGHLRLISFVVPLWLLAGCVEEERTRLVSPNAAEPVASRSFHTTNQAPATEKVAKRVLSVGQVIVAANPQLGLRPMFITTGAHQPEIFHKGTGALSGCQVVVSEGLVNRCATDGQLAAVLCFELGKVISEREALASPEQRYSGPTLPPDTSVGNEVGGSFGPADGTRMMEVAKLEKQRRQAASQGPPDPKLLAEHYLQHAGFTANDLAQVQTLLREADKNCILEKDWHPAITLPAPPPKTTAAQPAPTATLGAPAKPGTTAPPQ